MGQKQTLIAEECVDLLVQMEKRVLLQTTANQRVVQAAPKNVKQVKKLLTYRNMSTLYVLCCLSEVDSTPIYSMQT